MKKFTFTLTFNHTTVFDLSSKQAGAITQGLPIRCDVKIKAIAPNGKTISTCGRNAWSDIMNWIGPNSAKYL